MARIEKTVFISYRRTDVYTALAVYENLKNQGYDVFFDYRSISSGDFEQVITSNVRARAHFLLILTPTTLDRCSEPGDWVRQEIELAIDEKRNIVPLFFKGFRFGSPAVHEKLTGKLANLSRYNGLNVHEDYFEEAMQRVRTQFLSKPLDTVLHPVSTDVQKVVVEEQIAADEAIKQREEIKEPLKQVEEKPDEKAILEKLKSQAIQYELMGDFWDAQQTYYKIKKLDPSFPRIDMKIREMERELQPKPAPAVAAASVPRSAPIQQRKSVSWKPVAAIAGALAVVALLFWGGINLVKNLSSSTPEPTRTSQAVATKTSVSTTPALGIGSTMTGKDGMTLLYIPSGNFQMGSNDGNVDEKPIRIVFVDAYYIDKTEITIAMYILCVAEGTCVAPTFIRSNTREDYYENPKYHNYPVLYVTWFDANAYCEWVGRRLATETEWEKAARGTDKRVYPWGNNINQTFANYGNSVNDTSLVGEYPAGASFYGALDMGGNVWEWVYDWYTAYPGSMPSNIENNPFYGTLYRVLRGGSWHDSDAYIRSSTRNIGTPTTVGNAIGFRCAMDAP